MFPSHRHTPLPDPQRKRCPICHQAVYSLAGIHPQCAERLTDPPKPKNRRRWDSQVDEAAKGGIVAETEPGRGSWAWWTVPRPRSVEGEDAIAWLGVPSADRIQAVSRGEDRQDFFEVLTSTGMMTGSTSVLPQ